MTKGALDNHSPDRRTAPSEIPSRRAASWMVTLSLSTGRHGTGRDYPAALYL